MREYIAKDKLMEVAEIFTIDNTRSAIRRFIEEHRNEMRPQTIFALKSYRQRL